jgi:hypothetical protein
VKQLDGVTPLIPAIRQNFVCLQQTGDFCKN